MLLSLAKKANTHFIVYCWCSCLQPVTFQEYQKNTALIRLFSCLETFMLPNCFLTKGNILLSCRNKYSPASASHVILSPVSPKCVLSVFNYKSSTSVRGADTIQPSILCVFSSYMLSRIYFYNLLVLQGPVLGSPGGSRKITSSTDHSLVCVYTCGTRKQNHKHTLLRKYSPGVLYFLTLYPRLATNSYLFSFSCPSSWDYRYAAPHPA